MVSPSKPANTSKNRIYQDLRRAIVLGRHKPGERFNMENLAKQHGTSVTPVREALQMLGQDGLVTIEPHSGYFVSRINLKQLYDLFDLRQILEVAAVERAVHEITEEQLQQLENVNINSSSSTDESLENYVDENRRFHRLIGEASGNSELAKALDRLHDRTARFIVMRGGRETLTTTHARTIEALRKNDVAAARKAVTDEVTASREAIVSHVIHEDGRFWYVGERSTAS